VVGLRGRFGWLAVVVPIFGTRKSNQQVTGPRKKLMKNQARSSFKRSKKVTGQFKQN
jgi:hypothetical protein